ncbi:Uncharacterized protein PCOAH_00024020 [Plasmodium coatneyi]|uniref:Uncharacterized protein n=1 Tax=Plasmodium coatneyi TaxID=208452 RepID=A0A1B1DZQ7_9APIC|nr:Uncharacterized protein PCOAH_00024020 [Plasmodium coatneyi]ANQ08264.1 Uncharacterized protein PCOAH_00024020 [Plasmodium coatneyi]
MAQRLCEGAPVYPNEHSVASSPKDAATSPNGQLNQNAAKKGTHKIRRDQAFRNFIYQNIFNRDCFTNIFKKKIDQNVGRECNDQDNHTSRNEEDVCVRSQLPCEDEEYMLFLSYIYNDVASFIEINKNEHLKNSNYADLEDLILEICGTVGRDAFHNIKSIFKSPEGGAPRKETVCNNADNVDGGDLNNYASDPYNHDSRADKGKSKSLRSHSPSEKDSSFFFIPPMECLVTHIHKLTSKKDDANNVSHFSSDVNEFLKNNNFDKHPIYCSFQRGHKPREEANLSFQCELSHAQTGRVQHPPCNCCRSNGRNNLHSEVDTSAPDVPPTHSQEEITPNEKKHDEEGVQYIHTHFLPSEHTQVGTNFEVSSNNGKSAILVDIHNFNENEAILANKKSPDELTSSLLNGTTRSDEGGGIYFSFSRPNYANNSDLNGAAQGNSPHDGPEGDDYNDDDVVSVRKETIGGPFLREEKFMNGSLQGDGETHRSIHHYSQSNQDDEVFEGCLDEYVKPASGPNDNQDTDTNDDDSKADADSEEQDVADKMDGVASEVGGTNGVNTPSQDHHADEQTSNNFKREENIHLCDEQNSDLLEDDKEGILKTEGNDSPKEQPLKREPPKMEQQNETPQRIIQVDHKEYLEKQQKMVKNKTYAEPECRKEFTKNENPHDDYYHFKYLNNCEKVSKPYQYTKVEKKANIQVTPSPFPQFLRDIQIYNISQKKIRLKKTNIPLRKDDADAGITEKTTNKKKRQTRKRTK